MDAAKLADEIRGSDRGVRYANEVTPVVRVTTGSKVKVMHSPETKLLTSDADIIRRASTCSECMAQASAADIKSCTAKADCYTTYAKLVWPFIKHTQWCPCTRRPAIRIDPAAAKEYTQFKTAFEAGMKAAKGGKRPATAGTSTGVRKKKSPSRKPTAAAGGAARSKAKLNKSSPKKSTGAARVSPKRTTKK